jgi:hypothetical protein
MSSRRSLPKAVSPVREPKDTGPEAWPPVKIKQVLIYNKNIQRIPVPHIQKHAGVGVYCTLQIGDSRGIIYFDAVIQHCFQIANPGSAY